MLSVSVFAALFAGAVYAGGRSVGAWDAYSGLPGKADDQAGVRPTHGAPQGWREHTLDAAKLAVSLPPTWRVVAGKVRQTGEEELARTNPELAGFLADVTVVDDDTLEVAAFDLGATARQIARRDRFATNMSVRVDPARTSLPGLRAGMLQLVERMPALVPPIRDASVGLAAGKAVRLSYRVRIDTGAGETVVALTTYGLVARGRQYMLTYATTARGARAYGAMFDRSARTFRLLGA